MFTLIKNSFSNALSGTQNPWKIFWLWGVAVYFGAIVLGGLLLALVAKLELNYSMIILSISALLCLTMILFGLVMIYAFPIFFLLSLIKSAPNSGKIAARFFKIIFPIIFLLFHSFYYVAVIMVGNWLFFAFLMEYPLIAPLTIPVKEIVYNWNSVSTMAFICVSSLAVPVTFFLYRYYKNK